MSEGRLPTHLEVAALIRAVEAAGGFAAVLSRGEHDAGVILLLTRDREGRERLWERLPRIDGKRRFEPARERGAQDNGDFEGYLARRTTTDPDSWLIELDVANAERFIADIEG